MKHLPLCIQIQNLPFKAEAKIVMSECAVGEGNHLVCDFPTASPYFEV